MGDPAIGTNATVAVDFEASWGVAKGSPKGRKIAIQECGILPTQALLTNPNILGDFNPSKPVRGRKAAQGALNLVPNLQVFPFLQKLLTGTLVKTGSADPWLATSKLGSTMPASAIIESAFDIGGTMRYLRATGCRINSMTIPISFEGFLQLTMDVMAKDVTVETTAYDATLDDWTTDDPLEHLQLASAAVLLGGSPVGFIKGGQIQLSANLQGDDYRVGGAGARGSLVPRAYGISGNLQLALDSTAVLTLITSDTPTDLAFTWGVGTNRSETITLPGVLLEKTGPAVKDGLIDVPVNFQAFKDPTAGTAIEMEASIGVDPDTEYA